MHKTIKNLFRCPKNKCKEELFHLKLSDGTFLLVPEEVPDDFDSSLLHLDNEITCRSCLHKGVVRKFHKRMNVRPSVILIMEEFFREGVTYVPQGAVVDTMYNKNKGYYDIKGFKQKTAKLSCRSSIQGRLTEMAEDTKCRLMSRIEDPKMYIVEYYLKDKV